VADAVLDEQLGVGWDLNELALVKERADLCVTALRERRVPGEMGMPVVPKSS